MEVHMHGMPLKQVFYPSGDNRFTFIDFTMTLEETGFQLSNPNRGFETRISIKHKKNLLDHLQIFFQETIGAVALVFVRATIGLSHLWRKIAKPPV